MPTEDPNDVVHSLTIRQEWRRGGLVVASSHIGMAVGAGLYQFVSSLFVMPLSVAFGWSRGEISAAAAFGLIGALSAPVIGRLADRFGTRPVALVALALLGFNFLAMSQMTGEFYQFVILSLLFGILAPACTSLTYARAVTGWFDKARGQALGIMASGMSIGGLVFTPLVAWAIDNFGFAGGYIAMAVLPFFVGVPAILLGLRDRDERCTSGRPKSATEPNLVLDYTGRSVVQIVRSRSFLILAFAVFATNAPGAGIVSQLAPILDQNGVNFPVFMISLFSVAVVVGRIAIGYLFDEFDARHIAALICSLAVVGSLLFLSIAPVTLAFAGIVLVGFLLGMETDVIGYFISRNYGREQFGILSGLLFAASMLGNAVGVVSFGVIYDTTGSYDFAIAFISVLLIACATSYLLIPEGTESSEATPV